MKSFTLLTLVSAAFAQRFNTEQVPGSAPLATAPPVFIPIETTAPAPAPAPAQTDVPQSTPSPQAGESVGQPAGQPADNSCAALHFIYGEQWNRYIAYSPADMQYSPRDC
jgi:hypothetical protein